VLKITVHKFSRAIAFFLSYKKTKMPTNVDEDITLEKILSDSLIYVLAILLTIYCIGYFKYTDEFKMTYFVIGLIVVFIVAVSMANWVKEKYTYYFVMSKEEKSQYKLQQQQQKELKQRQKELEDKLKPIHDALSNICGNSRFADVEKNSKNKRKADMWESRQLGKGKNVVRCHPFLTEIIKESDIDADTMKKYCDET